MPEPDKRNHVANMYPSDRWKAKVSKMDDAQVIAIYMRDQERQQKQQETETNNDRDDIPF